MLAAKRLAHVALEVDLGECTLHSPPQNKQIIIKQNPLWVRRHPKSKTGVPVAPKKEHVSAKNLKEKVCDVREEGEDDDEREEAHLREDEAEV